MVQGSSLTDAVLALEARRREALLSSDWAALQGLLAEGLVYVHSTGASDTRSTYLAKLTGGVLRYQTLEFFDSRVQTFQNVAVVTGRMAATVIKDGQPRSVASLFMTVWSSEPDGVWRLHAHQGAPLPAA